MPDLCLHVQFQDRELHVSVVGRLDGQTTRALDEELSAILTQHDATPMTPIVFDLRCCTAIGDADATRASPDWPPLGARICLMSARSSAALVQSGDGV